MKKDNKGRKLQKGERQLSTGRYEFRYTDPDGRSRSVYSWRLTDADKTPEGKKDSPPLRTQEAKIEEQLSRGKNYYATEQTTLQDVFERYVECSDAKETTKAGYVRKYNYYIAPVFGARKIGSIVRSDILRWVGDLGKRIAGSSVNDVLILLKSILNFAVDDGLLEQSPAKKVKVRTDDDTVGKALTVAEQNAVMDCMRRCAPEMLRQVTEILIGTGLRISELLALTWRDIDFRTQTITINKSVYYGKLRGETATQSHIVPPKTKSSKRAVPMSDMVCRMFREMYEQQTMHGFCDLELDGHKGFIFFTQNGRLQTRSYIDAAYNNLVRKYNREHPDSPIPHLHAHMFRHTFVTRAIEAGVPPKTVSMLVGHANVTTTLEIYNSVTDENKRMSIGLIDQYMQSIYA